MVRCNCWKCCNLVRTRPTDIAWCMAGLHEQLVQLSRLQLLWSGVTAGSAAVWSQLVQQMLCGAWLVLLSSFCYICCGQVQLLTVLVRLEEVPAKQVRDVYKLLLDDSYAVRHAAAELVSDMLEESGQRHLAQVTTAFFSVIVISSFLWLHACMDAHGYGRSV